MPIEQQFWIVLVGASIGWLITRDLQNRWMINSLLRSLKHQENSIRLLSGLPTIYDDDGKEI